MLNKIILLPLFSPVEQKGFIMMRLKVMCFFPPPDLTRFASFLALIY